MHIWVSKGYISRSNSQLKLTKYSLCMTRGESSPRYILARKSMLLRDCGSNEHNTLSWSAFQPTFLPIENLQGNCMLAVFQKIQPYPGWDLNTGPWSFEYSALTTRLQQLAKVGPGFKTSQGMIGFSEIQQACSSQISMGYNVSQKAPHDKAYSY